MFFDYLIIVSLVTLCYGDRDDKKWVWNENNRNSKARSAGVPNSRYNVYDNNDDDFVLPAGTTQYFSPNQNIPVNQRPEPIYDNRPVGPALSFIPEQRPGNVYGQNSLFKPTYGGAYNPEIGNPPPALTGPVPSWIKDGPIKNFDKCKCAEKFNCNSPGISYGHCDVGKQYCCYSTKKDFLGGPIPSKPVHSIENGILAGPGGPVDPIPGVNYPIKYTGNRYLGPGGLQQGVPEQNEYSPANGVLVGPGGPFDAPPYGIGRNNRN